MRLWTMMACLGVAGCALPVEQTRIPDERPSILVEGAPPTAMLQVDGLLAGAVHTADGKPRAIRVEPGTHSIVVVSDGEPILAEKVFVSGAVMKTVAVPSGGMRP